MNSETTLLIVLGLAIFVIALVFGFSNGVVNSVEDAVLGNEDSDGIIDCNPADSEENCGNTNIDTGLDRSQFTAKKRVISA